MVDYARNSLQLDFDQQSQAQTRRRKVDPDPIGLHLLVETAVGDSANYDVMSIEDLYELKKEEAKLARQVPGLRRELALETKYRDAAQGFNRIDSQNGRRSGRMSQDEYAASVQKCDNLCNELYRSERRLFELRERRLQHTAGVLQMEYERRNDQAGFNRANGFEDSDDWDSGFSLSRFAPGGLADTEDGIMEIPGGKDPHTEATLHDLWSVLNSNDELIGQRDMHNGMDEEFSIEAFSEKVQLLCSRAAELSYDLDSEREARNVTESAQQENRQELMQQLQQVREVHEQTQNESQDHISALQRELQDHQDRAATLEQTHDEHESHIRSLQQSHRDHVSSLMEAHRQHQDHITTLQQADTENQNQIAALEGTIANLKATDTSSATRIAELEEAKAAAEAKHEEVEAEMIRLQTEVTIAKAELDGAYGTREQRKAEQAAGQDEIDSAKARVGVLEGELRDLLCEHEALVQQGVEAEREREKMEGAMDRLREELEGLRVRLSEERVFRMGRSGTASPASAGGAGVGERKVEPGREKEDVTSLRVIRSEFKKMMRDARSEHFRGLKVCLPHALCSRVPRSRHMGDGRSGLLANASPKAEQDERRRLEGIIRQLRKDQGIGSPGPNSPSTMLSPPPVGRSGLSRNVSNAS